MKTKMTKDEALRIKAHLQGLHDEMMDFLKELVSKESPTGSPELQNAIFDQVSDKLNKLDYFTLRMPGHQSGGYLYARSESRVKNDGIQLLIGHCDTVWRAGTLSSMPLTIEGEKLKGPGVYDMKAGLTQIIFALQTIAELDMEPGCTPVVLINSDEETGSKESTLAIRRLARIADRAFILEPPLGDSGKLKTSRKGLGRFTLTIKGKAAHAGLNPDEGINAILELSHQIQELFKLNDIEKGISINVGMIEGGTSPNVVAPESKAIVDVRVQTHEDAEFITKKIHDLKPVIPGSELQIEGRIGRPPMEHTQRNQDLWRLAKKQGQLIGLTLENAMAGGGSDGNTTSQFTATLDGLGTPGGGAHAPHEFIYTDKLIERTTLLTLLLLSKCKTQK